MSFSVHARAFVPSSEAATAGSPHGDNDAAASTKDCVCVAFYENGRCPYGSRCEHAHRFSELAVATQAKLLSTVPLESIPPHFFAPTSSIAAVRSARREDAITVLDAAVPRTFTAYAPARHQTRVAEAERTVTTRRRPPTMERPLVISHTHSQASLSPVEAAGSISSRTSSSAESPRELPPPGTGKSSSTSAGAATMTNHASTHQMEVSGSFKMYLPQRCRYPHRSIPGTYYDVLSLPRDASHAAVMAKYRAWQRDGFKRMRLIDPVGAEAVDRMIVEARNVLGSAVLRPIYDQHLPSPASTKPQPWTASVSAAGAPSTSTSPSKQYTQGQSSAASTASEPRQKLEEDINSRLGHSGSSNSSLYHADSAAPVVTISSLRHGDSIW